MSFSYERSLQEVAETLRNAKGRGCSLLIGAGCSVTAQIPLASDFVKEFERLYRQRYARVAKKTYPHCMAELAYNERSELIAPFIDKAKINWAHMAIAQLMKAGYITRILTTNFDPLVTKACATVGLFPAIYDLAASQVFKADRVYEPSVFYLHGQRAGFVTLHTDEEVQRHKQTLAPVFEDAARGRVWIVCGYSGDNDPVFEHLAAVPSFGFNLYWVGYKDAPPPPHVRDRLLQQRDKYAFYVPGYDADGFFVDLARALDCFPPAIIAKPFTHLLETTDLIAPFTIGDAKTDLREVARTRIQAAIDAYERGEHETPELRPDALDAMSLVFSGKYDEVLQRYAATNRPSEELREATAWALVAQADELSESASRHSDPHARDAAWTAAFAKYREALQIKPDMQEALYNWAIALAKQAEKKTQAEAEALWQDVNEKFAAALRMKPDDHEVLSSWADALSEQAKTKTSAEADALWNAAGEKYAEALRIKPADNEVLNDWGVTLSDQAETKTGAEADALWARAAEKYAEALRIKSNDHMALSNWGNAVALQAKTKTGAEADALWTRAGEKYAAALQIKPNDHEALYNWGNTLSHQAETKTGAEADALWKMAGEKYAAALQIKPDKHEALYNWGNVLSDHARTRTGAAADALWKMAGEKYAAALQIKPDKHEALYNWGNVLSDQAKTKTGAEADALWKMAGEKYAAVLQIKSDEHEALNNWGLALSEQAKFRTGAKADALWEGAREKYAAALQIEPNMHEALYNWGNALSELAKTKTGAEADALWEMAGEKYAATLQIKPDEHEALNNWTIALIDQASHHSTDEREPLFVAAIEKCQRANEIVEGEGSYNLACIHGIRDDAENCRKWLLHAGEHGRLPSRDYLLSDPDFTAVRDLKWFREIVDGTGA